MYFKQRIKNVCSLCHNSERDARYILPVDKERYCEDCFLSQAYAWLKTCPKNSKIIVALEFFGDPKMSTSKKISLFGRLYDWIEGHNKTLDVKGLI